MSTLSETNNGISRKLYHGRQQKQGEVFGELASLDEEQQPIILCRNRPFLPGSMSENFPETLRKYTHPEFKAIDVKENHRNDSIQLLGSQLRSSIDSYFNNNIPESKTRPCSALFIKNLPIKSANDFHDLIAALDYEKMTYANGSGFRAPLNKLVYTASDEPAEFTIETHNEMSYVKRFPSKVMLSCLNIAHHGGESPIVFNRDLIRDLDSTVVEKFRKLGVRYSRNIEHRKNTDYISWQDTFDAMTEDEAEINLKALGCEWNWQPNGNLEMWYTMPALYKHPLTGEDIWFNQATCSHSTYYKYHPKFVNQENLRPRDYPFHSCYGDGTKIEDEVLDHIRACMWNSAMSLKLFPGDVLILDNLLCQHSRMGFQTDEKDGSQDTRRVVVSLAEPLTRDDC